MTWVDGVIIVGAAIGAVLGYRQGIFLSAFNLLGLIVGVAIAGATSGSLVENLSSSAALWVYIVSFAIIVTVLMVAFNIIGQTLKRYVRIIMLSWRDSAGGAILGVLTGGLTMAAIFIAAGTWAAGEMGTTSVGTAIGGSALACFLIDTFPLLLGLLPERFDAVRELFK